MPVENDNRTDFFHPTNHLRKLSFLCFFDAVIIQFVLLKMGMLMLEMSKIVM